MVRLWRGKARENHASRRLGALSPQRTDERRGQITAKGGYLVRLWKGKARENHASRRLGGAEPPKNRRETGPNLPGWAIFGRVSRRRRSHAANQIDAAHRSKTREMATCLRRDFHPPAWRFLRESSVTFPGAHLSQRMASGERRHPGRPRPPDQSDQQRPVSRRLSRSDCRTKNPLH